MANGDGEGEGCEPDDKCENPRAVPPFLAWEGVLAPEIRELGRMVGCNFWSEAMDWDMRSITSESVVALPDFELFPCATGLLSSFARASANYCFVTARTSSLIRVSSEGEMVVPLYSSSRI